MNTFRAFHDVNARRGTTRIACRACCDAFCDSFSCSTFESASAHAHTHTHAFDEFAASTQYELALARVHVHTRTRTLHVRAIAHMAVYAMHSACNILPIIVVLLCASAPFDVAQCNICRYTCTGFAQTRVFARNRCCAATRVLAAAVLHAQAQCASAIFADQLGSWRLQSIIGAIAI